MRVLVIGAGIGGLTAASALAGAGYGVEVVDRRPDWDITGWGLSLTGPALRALKAIGVTQRCVKEGFGITEISTWSADGQLQRTITLPLVAGPGLPAQAGIMRTVLHRILLDRAAEAGIEPRLSTGLAALDQGQHDVMVRFTDGGTQAYDLVVGADGVGSTTRAAIGLESPATYLGQVVWRALVDRPDWCDRLCSFAGPEQVVGLIPISREKAYVWIAEALEDHTLPEGADISRIMRELLAGFGSRMDSVREDITDAGAIVRRQVEVHLADAPWSRGRVVLIGDAVHAPSPQLVTGAALAIEDGVILAEMLDEADVPGSLAAFSTRRYDRCRLVHEACVSISKLQLAGRTAEWTRVQAEAFAALASPA